MQSVTILRALWRRRIAVGVVALIAVLSGWMLTYRLSFPPAARGYDVGVATASILVDTPKSQVVEVAPAGSDELGTRANVLANIMVDGSIKEAIARRAGLAPGRLVASSQTADSPTVMPPLDGRSYAYATSVVLTSAMTPLPIIKVQSQAPDVQKAIGLANHVVTGLSEYLDSKAATETVPNARRLQVRLLGTAQGQDAARGPRPIIGLLVAVFVLIAGCAAILAYAALVRGWRAAAAEERANAQRELADKELEDERLEQTGSPFRRTSRAAKLRAS